MPEVAVANVVQQRRRLEACDVAAQLRGVLVGLEDDRARVPADDGAELVFDVAITGGLPLALRRNGIAVRRVERGDSAGPYATRLLQKLAHQKIDSIAAPVLLHRAQSVKPFPSLQGI